MTSVSVKASLIVLTHDSVVALLKDKFGLVSIDNDTWKVGSEQLKDTTLGEHILKFSSPVDVNNLENELRNFVVDGISLGEAISVEKTIPADTTLEEDLAKEVASGVPPAVAEANALTKNVAERVAHGEPLAQAEAEAAEELMKTEIAHGKTEKEAEAATAAAIIAEELARGKTETEAKAAAAASLIAVGVAHGESREEATKEAGQAVGVIPQPQPTEEAGQVVHNTSQPQPNQPPPNAQQPNKNTTRKNITERINAMNARLHVLENSRNTSRNKPGVVKLPNGEGGPIGQIGEYRVKEAPSGLYTANVKTEDGTRRVTAITPGNIEHMVDKVLGNPS